MINLTYLMKRRPDLDLDQFKTACIDLVSKHLVPELGTLGVKKHTLTFTSDPARYACLRYAHAMNGAAPDAILKIKWPSMAAYEGGLGSPQGLAWLETMRAHEAKIMQLSQSSVFLSEVDEQYVPVHDYKF